MSVQQRQATDTILSDPKPSYQSSPHSAAQWTVDLYQKCEQLRNGQHGQFFKKLEPGAAEDYASDVEVERKDLCEIISTAFRVDIIDEEKKDMFLSKVDEICSNLPSVTEKASSSKKTLGSVQITHLTANYDLTKIKKSLGKEVILPLMTIFSSFGVTIHQMHSGDAQLEPLQADDRDPSLAQSDAGPPISLSDDPTHANVQSTSRPTSSAETRNHPPALGGSTGINDRSVSYQEATKAPGSTFDVVQQMENV